MDKCMGLDGNVNSGMQGLVNKTGNGDCGIPASRMDECFVSVSEILPRLNKVNQIFTVNLELPDQCGSDQCVISVMTTIRALSIYISAVLSCGWAKASACCFQVCISCAVLCQMVSFQYSTKSSLHRFAGLLRNLFLPYGLQMVMRFVVFESADVSCPRPLHSSGCFYHVCDSCLCSHTGVCLSVMVCYIKHTPFHFCLRGR